MTAHWNALLPPNRYRNTTNYQDKMYDTRNAFENDYTRITLSPHFRRLQDKTQVFPYDASDFVRTRLTHSLEVSTFARSMGLWVEKHLIEKREYSPELSGHLSSCLAAAGLIHDVGNPPFGHFGEECIRAFFVDFFEKNKDIQLSNLEKEDFLKFDGNAQTFRVLRKLGPAHDQYSYNLTYSVLSCVIKYPFNSEEGNKKYTGNNISKKGFGFFQSEKDEFDELATELTLDKRRHPLVFILEAADDIAYSVSDIEDGCKKNIITEEVLRETIQQVFDGNQAKGLFKLLDNYRKEVPEDHPAKFAIMINRFRIEAQSQMIIAAQKCFINNCDSILSGEFDRDLLEASEAAQVRELFSRLAKHNFNHESVVKRELAGRSALAFLLREFASSIFSPNRENRKSVEHRLYSLISDNYKFISKSFEDYPSEDYKKLLLLVDFISGMTDTFALRAYHELSGISPY